MQPDGPLPRLQVPTTCPSPDPDQSSPYPHPNSCRSILILSSHLYLGLPSGLFPSSFLTKTLHAPLFSPVCAICPVHLILLHLITRIIFDESRLLSSSLCSILHSCITSSLLGPNIILSSISLHT